MTADSADRAHVYAAYEAAFARWPQVSDEVLAATDREQARRRVASLLGLDDVQADAVLALQVWRLAQAERTAIADQLAGLRAAPPDHEPGADAAADLARRWDAEPKSLRRSDFRVLRSLPTRWSDDDTYGHVNNVVHYLMFDTAVNGWLIEASGTDIRTLDAIGLVVETGCRYFAELRFPETVTAGIALEKVGTSSVVYRLALFGERSEAPAAVGRFVHVYVDRTSRRPVPVPVGIRTALRLLDR